MLKNLWNDEGGAILTIEIVLVMTILVIALVTGLSSLRDGIITELSDVGQAIGNADQSFTVGGTRAASSATPNFGFLDQRDFADGGNTSAFINSRCLVIQPVNQQFAGTEGI
ncbi:MAG TPA: hypothetical protein VL096_12655 [Pirellulaceae bacterium]|nr:hypothetical protein [Pirellulaceae bacterium]